MVLNDILEIYVGEQICVSLDSGQLDKGLNCSVIYDDSDYENPEMLNPYLQYPVISIDANEFGLEIYIKGEKIV